MLSALSSFERTMVYRRHHPVSLTQLVNDLRKAYEEHRLDKRMRVYLNPSYRLKDKIKTGIVSTPSTQVGQFYSGASRSNDFRS